MVNSCLHSGVNIYDLCCCFLISRAALPWFPIPLPHLPIQALTELSIVYMINYRVKFTSEQNRQTVVRLRNLDVRRELLVCNLTRHDSTKWMKQEGVALPRAEDGRLVVVICAQLIGGPPWSLDLLGYSRSTAPYRDGCIYMLQADVVTCYIFDSLWFGFMMAKNLWIWFPYGVSTKCLD